MKLRILVKTVEKLLGVVDDQTPRADMYLPDQLLAIALVFLAGGTTCVIFAAVWHEVWAIVGAPLGLVMGIMALLCWKNQSIHVISDVEFTYTTMFGNRYTYAFSDIQGIRKNPDSLTLFVAGKKVHIESMAVISDRLADLINRQLEKMK